VTGARPSHWSRRWLVLAATVAVNLALLYWPRAPGPGALDGVAGLDKIVHLATFASVAWAGLRAGLPTRWWLPLLAGHAVLSEVLQHALLPHRSGDPFDAVADVVGVLAGWWWARASWGSDRSGRGGDPDRAPARGDTGAG
jgi:hypothetical protein